MTAIGIRLAVVEPRISAAVFFGGGFVPGTLVEKARQVTIPLRSMRCKGPAPSAREELAYGLMR